MVKRRLTEFLMQGNEVESSSLYREGWSCWLGNKKCEDFIKQKLHKCIYQERAREYWSGKNKFKYKQFNNIDWTLVERVINKKPQMYKV